MFKQVIAFVFLFAFAMQTFSRAFIVFDYYTNTGNYAKNCVNKAKPKMHCNGKCQMMKKIQEDEKKNEKNPERKAENKNEIVLSSKSFFPTLDFFNTGQQSVYSITAIGQAIEMPRSILRPPIC